MKYQILSLIVLFFVFSCKEPRGNKAEQYDEREDDTEMVDNIPNGHQVQKQLGYGDLDKKLINLISYVKTDYPIKEVEDLPTLVHQSYYVAFFQSQKDTILAVCRQPFLMELFPDFAFEDNERPKTKPEYVGMVKNADIPIFIFDSGGMGNGFYKNAELVKEYPEKYLTSDGKEHDTIVPPIFKYKIENNNFKFLGKSKSQWID